MTDQTTIFKAIKSDFEQRIGAEERLGKMDRLLPVQKKKKKKWGFSHTQNDFCRRPRFA